MSLGSCNGIDIELAIDTVRIDSQIEIPDGNIVFINIKNDQVPISLN